MKLTTEQMVALYDLETSEMISLIATLSMTLSARVNSITAEELLMDSSMEDDLH
tara:strand:- start:135 stop:296 length:162 start_codon:yes stop_codon:yes gene_type:complete